MDLYSRPCASVTSTSLTDPGSRFLTNWQTIIPSSNSEGIESHKALKKLTYEALHFVKQTKSLKNKKKMLSTQLYCQQWCSISVFRSYHLENSETTQNVHWRKKKTIDSCGCLDHRSLHCVRHLITLSPIGSTVWEGLGSEVLLEVIFEVSEAMHYFQFAAHNLRCQLSVLAVTMDACCHTSLPL